MRDKGEIESNQAPGNAIGGKTSGDRQPERERGREAKRDRDRKHTGHGFQAVCSVLRQGRMEGRVALLLVPRFLFMGEIRQSRSFLFCLCPLFPPSPYSSAMFKFNFSVMTLHGTRGRAGQGRQEKSGVMADARMDSC